LQERLFQQEEEVEEDEGQKMMILKIKIFCMFVSSIRIRINYTQEEISLYILASSDSGRPSINCLIRSME
jgi:hypothetical protein